MPSFMFYNFIVFNSMEVLTSPVSITPVLTTDRNQAKPPWIYNSRWMNFWSLVDPTAVHRRSSYVALDVSNQPLRIRRIWLSVPPCDRTCVCGPLNPSVSPHASESSGPFLLSVISWGITWGVCCLVVYVALWCMLPRGVKDPGFYDWGD